MSIGGGFPNLNWMGRIGRTMFNKTLKNAYTGTLTAKWTLLPVAAGGFENADGQIIDPGTSLPVQPLPQTLVIAAYFDEAPNIEFKYAKWGVDATIDAIACVPWDTVIPPADALYYRAGHKDPYKLKGLIDKADIGVAMNGMLPEQAYLVLHLTQG